MRLSARRNCPSERSGCRSSAVRLFHSRWPAEAKQPDLRDVVVRCSTHVWTLENRSCRRLAALTSWQSSDRYGGARPFGTAWVALISRSTRINNQHFECKSDCCYLLPCTQDSAGVICVLISFPYCYHLLRLYVMCITMVYIPLFICTELLRSVHKRCHRFTELRHTNRNLLTYVTGERRHNADVLTWQRRDVFPDRWQFATYFTIVFVARQPTLTVKLQVLAAVNISHANLSPQQQSTTWRRQNK